MTLHIGKTFEVVEMDLDAHWDGVQRLLVMEEWPFIKEDLEISHSQRGAIAAVAIRAGKIIGFFTVHNFGNVAYLDMVIIEKGEKNRLSIMMSLWRFISEAMEEKGLTSQVAHCTNDSAPLLRLVGYKKGITFTLLRRQKSSDIIYPSPLVRLDVSHLPQLVALDTHVFGLERREWIEGLMKQRTAEFYGKFINDELVASVCLRERRESSLCIDSCNGVDYSYLASLIDDVVTAYGSKRLECFVKTDGDLHRQLIERGFEVPDFFKPIGPLTELRRGNSKGVGDGKRMHSLSWI